MGITTSAPEMSPTKIMLVGDSKVGKTAIQKRYCIAGQKVDKFFAALIHEIEADRQLEKAAMWKRRFDPYNCMKRFFKGPTRIRLTIFLMNKFCGVHPKFIDEMLFLFDQALVPVSIACFFVENGYTNKLQNLFPGLSQDFWLCYGVPLQQKREQSNQFVPKDIEAEFARYTQMMRKYQEGEYSALLTADLKFKQNFCFDADEYVPTYVPTTNMRETENGDVIVCDTPAMGDWERFFDGFKSFGPMIDAIILVYDIGNRDSFDRIQQKMHRIVDIMDGNDQSKKPIFMLVGNKCDVADDARQVSKEEGKSRAICFEMPFMEVSARENINIESAFITLAKAVKKKDEEKDEEKKRKEREEKEKMEAIMKMMMADERAKDRDNEMYVKLLEFLGVFGQGTAAALIQALLK